MMIALVYLTIVAVVLLTATAFLIWRLTQRLGESHTAIASLLKSLCTLQAKELELRVAYGRLKEGEGRARLRERIAIREEQARQEQAAKAAQENP